MSGWQPSPPAWTWGAVPACPDWTVRDLIRHTGSVHRWATGFVAGGRTQPSPGGLDEAVETWPADDDLAGRLGEGCIDLVAALATASDDLQCWTSSPPRRRVPCGRADRPTRRPCIASMRSRHGNHRTRCVPAFAAVGIDESWCCSSPPRRQAARRPAGHPGRALHRRRCLVAVAHGRRGGDHHGRDGRRRHRRRRRRRRRLHGPWDGPRSLPGAVRGIRTGADDLALQGDRAVLGQFSGAVRIR